MKKSVCFSMLILSIAVFIQAQPQGFSYQALVRDGAGAAVRNRQVGVSIRIYADSANSAAPVYLETQTPTTNGFGNINLIIGRGTTIDNFGLIDWSRLMFINVRVDINGGTAYIDLGTTQLMSVPYALYSGKSGTASLGQTSRNFYSSNYTFVFATDSVYKPVLGFSQNVTVPSGVTTLIQTSGLIVANQFNALAISYIGLFIDGILVSPGGESKVYITTDDNISSGGGNWSLNYPATLSPGNHTIELMTKGQSQSQSSLTVDYRYSSMTVTFLKN